MRWLMRHLNSSKARALNLIFPAQCFGCNRLGNYLCHDCARRIPAGQSEENLICCARYDRGGVLAKLMQKLKYSGVRNIACSLDLLIRRGAEQLCLLVEQRAPLTLVPVPMAKWRRLERGFNQAEIIAERLRKILNEEMGLRVKIAKNVLHKKCRPKQSTLRRSDRLQNLVGAIAITKEGRRLLENKIVVIVDDVATTLSTIRECKRAIKEARPRVVFAIVLARAGRL